MNNLIQLGIEFESMLFISENAEAIKHAEIWAPLPNELPKYVQQKTMRLFIGQVCKTVKEYELVYIMRKLLGFSASMKFELHDNGDLAPYGFTFLIVQECVGEKLIMRSNCAYNCDVGTFFTYTESGKRDMMLAVNAVKYSKNNPNGSIVIEKSKYTARRKWSLASVVMESKKKYCN
jgi:hypothetical protein